jgi:hypothetical protein
MTHAAIDTTVTSVDGQVVRGKEKAGEPKLLMTPGAIIRVSVVSSRNELTLGAHMAMGRDLKKSDETYETDRVHVGRDGIVPSERLQGLVAQPFEALGVPAASDSSIMGGRQRTVQFFR